MLSACRFPRAWAHRLHLRRSFLQQPLQKAAEDALADILKASEGLDLVTLVGLPVNVSGKLYNCAAVVCRGQLLGLVPKSHIPNYGEFYESGTTAPRPPA